MKYSKYNFSITLLNVRLLLLRFLLFFKYPNRSLSFPDTYALWGHLESFPHSQVFLLEAVEGDNQSPPVTSLWRVEASYNPRASLDGALVHRYYVCDYTKP